MKQFFFSGLSALMYTLCVLGILRTDYASGTGFWDEIQRKFLGFLVSIGVALTVVLGLAAVLRYLLQRKKPEEKRGRRRRRPR
jgi:hypothetical protein